ncbi:2-hydroxyacid dehydrogenase [Mycoplasma marinum]|uniref:2-hydroxyacid dehydrogenase n=1 Tax=Mycoplasma marinum TaxID=1937190 RepID=A0A4R0XLP7_9MOLU|nr:2-hydroxyacid dehydrogenase [Mycoplasma marinum]TCG10352.1 2-hydroxyacid dehydrogenase [Mycoplasma marinum]
MKIAFFDTKQYDKTTFAKANKNGHEFNFITQGLSVKTAELAKGSEAICAFVNCDGSREVLEKLAAQGIKYWFQRSAGYNRIDLKAAEELGIKVFRVPAYSPEAVCEFAMTLLMSLNRNIHLAHNRVTNNNFSLNGLEGETIFGKTIGVIGAGRIGQGFIKIANGLGAKVVVYDEYAQNNFPQTAEALGFTYLSKEEVFAQADFLSIHAPLLPSTKYIVNKDTLALMKPSAIIVNTARGPLINTEDLLEALDNGKLRGAGLDVYENEAGVFFFDKSNEVISDSLLTRLRAHRNVILTSHQAFFTNLALEQIATTTTNNIELAIKKEDGTTRLILQEDGKVING